MKSRAPCTTARTHSAGVVFFGTFEEGPIVEAGTGPTEPTLWQKFMMPIREPVDTAIAPR